MIGKIQEYLSANAVLEHVLSFLINTVLAIVVAAILLGVSAKLFSRLHPKKTRLNTQFAEKMFRLLIIFLCIIWIMMSNDYTKSFGQSLFQSTAILAAIAGFAAQSVLSDLICGIILSSTKPFEVGDRIELENGIAGIVKDMTLRHVVIQGIDTQVYTIPNSKVNGQLVRNMSYKTRIRSAEFHFSVSYDTEPEFASAVIRRAIMDSPLSVPGKKGKEGQMEYAGVYFMSFKDSCLDLVTTAYYEPDITTEAFRNDINTRVKKALGANGIEIPYNYLNVMVGQRPDD